MIYLSTTSPKKVILQNNTKQPDVLNSSVYYYTFKITSCDSFTEYVFSPDNFSQSPYYDAFTLSIGSVSSPTGSVVINAEAGQYNFEVYRMPNAYNLNIASASYITEQGILQIIGEGTVYNPTTPVVFTQSDADTIKVFNEL